MDLDRLRRLAGIVPVNEAFDDDDEDYGDDDDLDAAERELAKVAEKDLKKSGVDVDKDFARAKKADKQKTTATKKEEPEKTASPKRSEPDPHSDEEVAKRKAIAAKVWGDTSKKEAPIKKDNDSDKTDEDDEKEEKKEAAAKRRGRTESERTTTFRKWVESHPNAKRSEALAYAATLGMSGRHANTKFYAFKKRLNEFWVIANTNNAKVLAENSTTIKPLWVKYESADTWDAMIFESQDTASAAAKTLFSMGQNVVIIKFDRDEE